MRGLISINVKVNNAIINNYPILMYFAGQEADILQTLKGDNDLKKYLIDNCVRLSTYANCKIYYITYLSDDIKETEEIVDKKEVYLYNIIPIEDVYTILMDDALDNVFNTHDINEIKNAGITTLTIINAVRHAALRSGISREHCSVLVKMIQNQIQ